MVYRTVVETTPASRIVAGTIWNQTFSVLASDGSNMTTVNDYQLSTKFNPSMAIIIIVLISAFLFMGFFSIYVRRCTTSEPEHTGNNGHQNVRVQSNNSRAGQGLDREIVESLPLVGHSLVKGLKGGKDLSECAVCLSEFEEDEVLRLLPKCGHLFHPECIDMWFYSHSTCPLCRASLLPSGESKESIVEGFPAWATPQASDGDRAAISINELPPALPNGSILELLSRDGVERILAESLRRDGAERMDAGLSSREEQVGEHCAPAEMRALNRALSKNSMSFRKAARGVEVSERIGAASESARFHPSHIAGAVTGVAMGSQYFEKSHNRSVGSSQSFNALALRRSSSVGSSGRYIRQLFGQNYAEYFSPESAQDGLRIDRARLLGEHRMPSQASKPRRQKSEDELQNMFFNELHITSYTEGSSRGGRGSKSGELWDSIDLQTESSRGVSSTQQLHLLQQQQFRCEELTPWGRDSLRSGELTPWGRDSVRSGELTPWGRGLDSPFSVSGKSGELPPAGRVADQKRLRLGEASGPLYVRRKANQAGEERTRSDRWNFNIRRPFNLRRTFSDSRDQLDIPSVSSSQNEGSRWWYQGSSAPTVPAAKPKKYSPWAAAMKDRRSSAGNSSSAPTTPSPSTTIPSSPPSQGSEQQPHQQHQPSGEAQSQQQQPSEEIQIQIVTQQ